MLKKKLKINNAAGIVDIVNAVLVSVSWIVVLGANAGGSSTVGTASFFYIMAGVGLVLHIIGLVQSKKNGISIIGHVIGIVGCGVFLMSIAFALPAFVLLILAAVFTLMQKNIAV